MPYWYECPRCDGRPGNTDCGKCGGTGRDYRDDSEYEWAKAAAERCGVELHHINHIPGDTRNGGGSGGSKSSGCFVVLIKAVVGIFGLLFLISLCSK